MTALPLAGLKVVDLTRLLPGAFCSQLLADFGAEVLKVEDTGLGDYLRWWPPSYEGTDASTRSAQFLALNRNKRSLRLDLKRPEGCEVLARLAAGHDVVLESFRPGVLERLGVGYERLRERNPGLVWCAITGYGQDGPYRERPGHDLNFVALAGVLGLMGERDGPPVAPAVQIGDLGGALFAAFGILAALRERERSGEGQLVDVSMTHGALGWLAPLAAAFLAGDEVPRRGELALAGAVISYRPYRCADGWMALAALEPKFWAAFCRGVGREDLLEHHRARVGSPAHAELEALFAARTRAEWEAFAAEHECCLEPVLGLDEALESELVTEREGVVGLDQPGAQPPPRVLGAPLKLTRTPADPGRSGAPVLGADSAAVLAELGYSEAEAAALIGSGAVAGRS